MFVDEEYKDFKYLVGVSDNYIILTNQKTVIADWQNPEEIDIIYQYIEPSTIVVENTRTVSSNQTYTEIETRQDYWSRADSPKLTITGISILILILILANGLTRIVKKGGIFFGN